MKLEKFDLEKFIHGAKVVTRDGREVLELTKFENLGELPLVGVVDGDLETWSIKGKYSRDIASNMDLCIVGEVQSIYANVMKSASGDLFVSSKSFSTLEAALDFVKNPNGLNPYYVKTIQITDEV
jgi:hypothetical protein